MSIVNKTESDVSGIKKVEAVLMRTNVNDKGQTLDEVAPYTETEEELKVSSMILKHFCLGTTNMYTPRVEFNDLSLINRDQYDQMSFNTYQPNNGEAWEGNPQAAWRSRAIRPVVRNKCISIAAHSTSRLIFPKIFAYNKNSDEQQDAAQTMEDLMEWSGDVSNYPFVALMRVITAMSSPASIGFTEYGEIMRTVKTHKEDGKWVEEKIRDEAYPCFMDEVVPVNQFYIENFYEPDVQRQGWVIWRKVYAFSEAQAKYNGVYDNFKFVRPGVQTIYDDANRTFYYVYDPNMRSEDVEEVIYWNKNLDIKIIMVNRVMLTPWNNPNPRNDKLYPFDKFGYEPINNRFFYYKSLSFKLQHDADIINTIYQMVIDGTFLAIFKPMVNVGGEIIASDVIVPGAVTTLSSPDADLRAINVGSDLKAGLEMMNVIEQSINESSQEPLQQGANEKSGTTAYEISRLEANANTVLGLFLQMIAKHVRDFGKLRVGDIVQYLTLPDVATITGDSELTYRTFFLRGLEKTGGKNKKIEFTNDIPDEMSQEDFLDRSYAVKEEEDDKDMTITKANPKMFRELQYLVAVHADVLNPRSEDLERAWATEEFDRMIAHPETFDPKETGKLLLGANPTTKKDIEKYLAKEPPMGATQPIDPATGMPAAGNSPLGAVMKKSPLGAGAGTKLAGMIK
jgi:uncharacterized membrane protein